MTANRSGRVLIVDDDRQLARTVSLRFSAAGFEVFIAHQADEASRLAVRERPDIILLDINMPHFSGIDLHHCLRFASRSREIPVVYISGESSLSTRRTAFELGAAAFISKPFDAAQLLTAVRDIIHRRTTARCAPNEPVEAGSQPPSRNPQLNAEVGNPGA